MSIQANILNSRVIFGFGVCLATLLGNHALGAEKPSHTNSQPVGITSTSLVSSSNATAALANSAARWEINDRGDVNPPKTRCATANEALIAALAYATKIHGTVQITSGTPSMEPLIHGKVYVVVCPRPYASIRERQLLIYMGRPNANLPGRQSMLHRAVMHDDGGWIMSGDNNARSENWDRVTPATYVGTVEALFEVAHT